MPDFSPKITKFIHDEPTIVIPTGLFKFPPKTDLCLREDGDPQDRSTGRTARVEPVGPGRGERRLD